MGEICENEGTLHINAFLALQRHGEFWRKFEKIWEILGTLGKIWGNFGKLGEIWGNSRESWENLGTEKSEESRGTPENIGNAGEHPGTARNGGDFRIRNFGGTGDEEQKISHK